jgi:hypothetical protein
LAEERGSLEGVRETGFHTREKPEFPDSPDLPPVAVSKEGFGDISGG